MSARDELADILHGEGAYCGGCGYEDGKCPDCTVVLNGYAGAILAAGYRKPRIITTPEELDALPDRTVVMTAAGSIVNIVGDRAYIFGYESSAPRRTLSLPATVLYEPGPGL